ncbi:MAG TPA: signal peptidase I, partial [Planctomycetota bacterium]|nr:signal peptidase I [Planctomycetota bacterium]
MAPTLLGAHFDVVCPNCGKPQPVSDSIAMRDEARHDVGNAQGQCPQCHAIVTTTLPDDALAAGHAEAKCTSCGAMVPMSPILPVGGAGDRVVTATCSNCGIEFEYRVNGGTWPLGSVSRGDRILVDKFSYHFQSPRRFDVAVFKYPRNPSDNYIKRMIGLPGELIDVEDGDIYIDGKIARKPASVQDEMWRPIHEARYVEKDGGGIRKPPFRTEGGTWEPIEDGRAWKGEPGAGAEPAWLVYNREVRDVATYNGQHN